MNKRKLDSLLWEKIPFKNFIIVGHSDIKQENLDEVFWEDVDELCVSRDDDYNTNISCVRYLNKFKEKKAKTCKPKTRNCTWLGCSRGQIRNKNIQ